MLAVWGYWWAMVNYRIRVQSAWWKRITVFLLPAACGCRSTTSSSTTLPTIATAGQYRCLGSAFMRNSENGGGRTRVQLVAFLHDLVGKAAAPCHEHFEQLRRLISLLSSSIPSNPKMRPTGTLGMGSIGAVSATTAGTGRIRGSPQEFCDN